MEQNRVRCYVDGLNFYYGVAKPYNLKWIDLNKLLGLVIGEKFPGFRVEKILLFTSHVLGDAANRQKIYLQALERHTDNLEIKYGQFIPVEKTVRKGNQSYTGRTLEEKGTDVNLACSMLTDAYTVAGERFDVSCLVSNDSDFSPVLSAKKELSQRTILISPLIHEPSGKKTRWPTKKLANYVPRKDRIPCIKRSDVEKCLLPPEVNGLRPPESWASR